MTRTIYIASLKSDACILPCKYGYDTIDFAFFQATLDRCLQDQHLTYTSYCTAWIYFGKSNRSNPAVAHIEEFLAADCAHAPIASVRRLINAQFPDTM